jgi:hypothetical protein
MDFTMACLHTKLRKTNMVTGFIAGYVLLAGIAPGADRIDRQSLVTRHNIEWNEATGQIPLGNGEFCFNADGTGLQTFGGNSMSHWGWHSFPLPEGEKPENVPATGTLMQGRVQGGDSIGTSGNLRSWMFNNPHIMNLGRIRLCRSNGVELAPTDITGLTRTLDLWSGAHTSVYQIDGEPVSVETCVHPSQDAVAVRIESPLIVRGLLHVVWDFPYPTLRNDSWVGDFKRTEGHQTAMTRHGERRADFRRVVDAATYSVSLEWSMGATLTAANDNPHRFVLAAKDVDRLQFVCAFSPDKPPAELPGTDHAFAAAAGHWKSFWSNGGAIDLSASKDPRWKELERRIVLSQYHMAAQSAGSWPSAESGLMGIDPWRGQFHMEMIWWHLAHYGLWDRWDMADEALGCYKKFAPVARQLATQLGYKGFKWPKSVGPEGRSAPWEGNQVLLWKQPHPIFFAELEYRLRPTRATLEKWADIIDGTAENMADYPTKDESTGIYSLMPVMPPSEQGITRDTVFDLAYWRWGFDKAQEWRERMGLPRQPLWDEVRNQLAPLPVVDGVFVHSAEWHDTYTKRAYEHPDPVGVFGMLPPTPGVDREIAHRTVKKVWETWNWDKTWGWDCPWIAMAAARVGEPEMAVNALLNDSARNQFDQRGVNTGGPCPYLPGNGGLLYAVAMMAAGWDGAPARHAPGFPDDGSWVVKWEGLKTAP